jgi:DNA-binding response OmpR family regulator
MKMDTKSEKMRLESNLKFTPILFISGKNILSERIEAYEAGGDNCIKNRLK